MKQLFTLTLLFVFYFQTAHSQPGKLDSTFASNGIVTADLGAPFNYEFSAKKVLAQSDGSVYLVIQTGSQVIITKRLSDGSADSSYGHNGFNDPVTISANDAAIEQNGKIVVVGRTNGSDSYNFQILRYNKNGSPDSSFSGDGKETTDFSESSYSEATSVAIQSDGKIVAAGVESINAFQGETAPFAYSIARYNIDGSLDKSFSGDGKEFNYSFAGAKTIAIQQDGKIVVAGGDVSFPDFGIARYKTDGNPDSTFSGDGIQTTNSGYDAKSVTIQKDGKILIAGKNNSYFFTLARYNKNGSTDSTFGTNGVQTDNVAGEAISVNLTNDGKIIALGSEAIIRYNKDGSTDNTFGENGIVTLTIRTVTSIALQNDEKIIAAGSVFVRYTKDGKPDNTFNTDGKLPLNIHPGLTSFSKTKIQKDGKSVVAGTTWNGSNFCFAIARFNNDGSVDSTFDTDGKQLISLASKDHAVTSLAIQNDGKIVVSGNVFDTCDGNGCHYKYYILRCNSNGGLDHSFGSNGIQPADFPVNSLTLQNDGRMVVAGSIGSDFAVFRYKADGSLDNTFSGDGKQVTPFFVDEEPVSSYANSVAIQSDGKIVAGGITDGQYSSYVIARYNNDGSPDSAFGKKSVFPDPNSGKVVIQNDGKIVVAGSEYYRGYRTFDIVRFNTDGSPDQSFSEDGFQQTGANSSDYLTSAAIQSDGKIIVAGSAIIRLNEDGSVDSAFGNNGIVTTIESEGNEFINDIDIAGNKLYAVGYSSFAGRVGAIARYLLANDTSSTPPTVSITTPADNAVYIEGTYIKVNATATDTDGTITKVEFYSDSTLLHTQTVAPYGYQLKHLPVGNYTITAKAYDNSGNVTTSAPVHITVVENQAPIISITTPANNAIYRVGNYIKVNAAATDADGTITKVEFYADSTLLHTETEAPYGYQLKHLTAGTYTITARATDNLGLSTTSAPVTITVTNVSIVSSRLYSQNKKTASNSALSVRVFPNPATQIVNLQTQGLQPNKPATISIISNAGIVLQNINISNATQTMQLNVSSLAKGVYTIKIISGNKNLYKQFVKL